MTLKKCVRMCLKRSNLENIFSLYTRYIHIPVAADKAVDRFGFSRLSSISLQVSISFMNLIALKVQLEAEYRSLWL